MGAPERGQNVAEDAYISGSCLLEKGKHLGLGVTTNEYAEMDTGWERRNGDMIRLETLKFQPTVCRKKGNTLVANDY